MLLLIVLVIFSIFGSLALAMQDSKKPEKIDKEKCLGCHGPFDKIAKATENWKAPSGETTTPHRYIPHDSEDVPECTECHMPHTLLPLPDKSAVVKPKDMEFCFNACHHAKNLQPCKTCH
jgi:hypothetical protein